MGGTAKLTNSGLLKRVLRMTEGEHVAPSPLTGIGEKSKPSNADQTSTVDLLDDAQFNIKIHLSPSEIVTLQVNSSEIVQEIHHALTEQRYTTREVRNHVKHINELLNSIKVRDAYAGRDQMSLSFLSSVTMGDIFERKPSKSDASINFHPPTYIMPTPGLSEPPLVPLHPYNKEDNALTCLRQLNYSNWNPPPPPRRLAGDLVYLVVHTLEDKRCHITACSRGFFVNQTTDDVFNPKPVQNAYVAHSLIDLLKQLSPAFKKSFENLLKRRSNKHPFERFPTPYQVYSWLSPQWEHTPDSVRKDEAFASRMACEENLPGQTRDWNDELQATRELPQAALNDRLVRDRAIFKSNSDFVAAATRAAVSVVNGDIMAINPGETRKQQMFIWNNMFFSLGFDVKDHYKELGGEAAAYVATSNDLNGVRAYSLLDQPGLCTLGTAIIDYRGYRVTAQTIIPGILEKEQEQLVVYGSIDFGKTVVDDARYHELLGKTAKNLRIRPHYVVDQSGKEIELLSSVDCKGIIGNDNRAYILDLLHTFPPDVNYLGGAPANIRPVLSPAMTALGYPYTHRHLLPSLRQELLDAFCESRHDTFLRTAARELQTLRASKANSVKIEEIHTNDGEEAAVNGDAIMHHESNNMLLLNADSAVNSVPKIVLTEKTNRTLSSSNGTDNGAISEVKKAAEDIQHMESETTEAIGRSAKALGSLSDTHFEIAFNPDVYQSSITFAKSEEIAVKKDEKLVCEVCEFLVLTQIPAFIQDCLAFTVMPQDGRALVETLHQRGINVRYLNRVIEALAEKSNLAYLHRLAVSEVLIRSTKHIFKTYAQEVDPMFLSAAVAHFLNCFLTTCPNLSPLAGVDEQVQKLKNKKGKKRGGKQTRECSEDMSWTNETSASLWARLNKEVKEYYHIDLELTNIDDFCQKHGVSRTQILRSFCHSVGIQLTLREYSLQPPNGAKHHQRPVFTLEDVTMLFPLVKHLHPHATDAYTFFNTGQARISAGYLQEGFELISEALNLLNTVYGPLHPDIGACNRLLARLSYVLGEHEAALLFQQRATMISERVHGIDSPSTAAEYIHMALYCFACGHIHPAFQLLYRARYLALLCHGEDHPEIAQIDVNISLMLHAVEQFDTAVVFLENALRLSKIFYGPKSLKVAFNCHLLSQTHAYRGDFRSALDFEKQRYSIYRERFGDDSDYTRDSDECLRTLTTQAVNMARRFQQSGTAAATAVTNGSATGSAANKQNSLQVGRRPGQEGHVAATSTASFQLPSFVTILDTLNRVNGIFYLQLSQSTSAKKESGNTSSVKITPCVEGDEPQPSSTPMATSVSS
nr:unnamed protein product [Spirometra erinaceieuropaei]